MMEEKKNMKAGTSSTKEQNNVTNENQNGGKIISLTGPKPQKIQSTATSSSISVIPLPAAAAPDEQLLVQPSVVASSSAATASTGSSTSAGDLPSSASNRTTRKVLNLARLEKPSEDEEVDAMATSEAEEVLETPTTITEVEEEDELTKFLADLKDEGSASSQKTEYQNKELSKQDLDFINDCLKPEDNVAPHANNQPKNGGQADPGQRQEQLQQPALPTASEQENNTSDWSNQQQMLFDFLCQQGLDVQNFDPNNPQMMLMPGTSGNNTSNHLGGPYGQTDDYTSELEVGSGNCLDPWEEGELVEEKEEADQGAVAELLPVVASAPAEEIDGGRTKKDTTTSTVSGGGTTPISCSSATARPTSTVDAAARRPPTAPAVPEQKQDKMEIDDAERKADEEETTNSDWEEECSSECEEEALSEEESVSEEEELSSCTEDYSLPDEPIDLEKILKERGHLLNDSTSLEVPERTTTEDDDENHQVERTEDIKDALISISSSTTTLPATAPAGQRWVPPHLRKKANAMLSAGENDSDTNALKQKLQGLLNRLSEGNLDGIAIDVCALLKENLKSRTTSSAATSEISKSCPLVFTFFADAVYKNACENPHISILVVACYAAVVVAACSTVDVRCLSAVTQLLEKKFYDYSTGEKGGMENKSASAQLNTEEQRKAQEQQQLVMKNVVLLIALLFHFGVLPASVIFQMFKKLMKPFEQEEQMSCNTTTSNKQHLFEQRIDIALAILRYSGKSLRARYPSDFKQILDYLLKLPLFRDHDDAGGLVQLSGAAALGATDNIMDKDQENLKSRVKAKALEMSTSKAGTRNQKKQNINAASGALSSPAFVDSTRLEFFRQELFELHKGKKGGFTAMDRFRQTETWLNSCVLLNPDVAGGKMLRGNNGSCSSTTSADPSSAASSSKKKKTKALMEAKNANSLILPPVTLKREFLNFDCDHGDNSTSATSGAAAGAGFYYTVEEEEEERKRQTSTSTGVALTSKSVERSLHAPEAGAVRGAPQQSSSSVETRSAGEGNATISGSDSASLSRNKSTTSPSTQNDQLLQLAKEQRLATDSKRSVFVALQGADDDAHAILRIKELKIPPKQKCKDVAEVVIHCALRDVNSSPADGRAFNPFYSLVMLGLCAGSSTASDSKKYQHAFKNALIPRIQEVHKYSIQPMLNLALLFASGVAEDGVLPLSLLRYLDFSDAVAGTGSFSLFQGPHGMFMREVLAQVLEFLDSLDAFDAIFSPLKQYEDLKEGVLIALRKLVKPFLLEKAGKGAGGSKESEDVKLKLRHAERCLVVK
ncbi:unnamed protein product [Amoebophrya sp. A120]|nr:unnamed protein product [Amoebophrya sp. A120]|eukprot:GSA120T00009068001.1